MTIVSVMQPYFFPYLGIFELIKRSDIHVLLDDVNFRKKGFINRNSVYINNEKKNFNLKLNKISQNKLIKDHTIFDQSKEFLDLLKSLNVPKSFIHNVSRILEAATDKNLVDILEHLLRITLKELGIETTLLRSSEISKKQNIGGQDRILEICKTLGATKYLNAPGGVDLYSQDAFAKQNLRLEFLELDYKRLSCNENILHQSILGLIHTFGINHVRCYFDLYNA